MSTLRDVLVSLWVLDLELVEMIAPTLFQSLSEGTKQNQRGVLPPEGHVVAHDGQLIRQPLHEINNRSITGSL